MSNRCRFFPVEIRGVKVELNIILAAVVKLPEVKLAVALLWNESIVIVY